MDSVYTAEQAARGKDVYAGSCKSCHSAASHSGVTFANWWEGKAMADLFTYISRQMPKNDPGSLQPDQYADVTAYLLKMNAMPAGATELVPDSTALVGIRIVMPKPKPKATPPAPARRRPQPSRLPPHPPTTSP